MFYKHIFLFSISPRKVEKLKQILLGLGREVLHIVELFLYVCLPQIVRSNVQFTA